MFIASDISEPTYGQDIDSFRDIFKYIRDSLINQPTVNVGEWQSQQDDSKFKMKELLHVAFDWQIPATPAELGVETGARLPWAEDHFLERVGGEPLNPSPSEAWWPFREKRGDSTNASHKSEGEAFSHTYPERMWPKRANDGHTHAVAHKEEFLGHETLDNFGIRFDYGDLQDVVNQLIKSPYTRQAYLPIWFPEDTGAVHGKRVPCTLGYHFIIRDGALDISYFMRSTDLLRHFQDDIYLAGRLAQWVVNKVLSATAVVGYNFENPQPDPLVVGKLIFHTANMHIFEGDVELINYWKTIGKDWF